MFSELFRIIDKEYKAVIFPTVIVLCRKIKVQRVVIISNRRTRKDSLRRGHCEES